VLPTIRSRTQHFDFSLLSHDELLGHLADVLAREGIDADAEALEIIARRAAGSARDALSLLDQALAVGAGRLDAQQVQNAFGGAPFARRIALLEAVAGEDVAGVLVGVHDLLADGHDPRRVADDLLRTLRDAFLQANASGRVPYDGPREESAQLTAVAKRIGNAALVRALEILGQAMVDIRGQAISDPRLVLEIALVRMARKDARTSEETLLARVERLEEKIANGAAPAPPVATTPAATSPADPPVRQPNGPLLARRVRPAATAAPESAPEPEPVADPVPGPVATTEAAATQEAVGPPEVVASGGQFTLDDVIEAWPDVLGQLKAPTRAAVQDAQPIALDAGVIVFGVPSRRKEAINERFRKEAGLIKDAFATRLGTQPRFTLRTHNFEALDALRPPSTSAAPTTVAEADEETVDLHDLIDAPNAPDAPPADSVARLVADLGASVVEERPR
jgi:DNA polymerase III subunit gamma/tau